MLIKVCDKCGKIKTDRVFRPGELCQYCQGKMIIKGQQNGVKAEWKQAQR